VKGLEPSTFTLATLGIAFVSIDIYAVYEAPTVTLHLRLHKDRSRFQKRSKSSAEQHLRL